MERNVETKQEGQTWAVYAEGKLLQDGLSSEALALKVAFAVQGVLEPYVETGTYHSRVR